MSYLRSRKPSAAMITACAALFMSATGGAVAATTTTGSHSASKSTPTLRCVWVDQRGGESRYDLDLKPQLSQPQGLEEGLPSVAQAGRARRERNHQRSQRSQRH